MARVLTGIQSTGTPHLGNILGAILPAVQMASDPANDLYCMIKLVFLGDFWDVLWIFFCNFFR